jgi:hypothetical protein
LDLYFGADRALDCRVPVEPGDDRLSETAAPRENPVVIAAMGQDLV